MEYAPQDEEMRKLCRDRLRDGSAIGVFHTDLGECKAYVVSMTMSEHKGLYFTVRGSINTP